MKTLIRWCKFNLVGAVGMAVQLASLAAFNHCMHGHYLVATAIAIELTLLHNFAWHWRYTWRDRRSNASLLRALLRFHLSNGLVSMLGNLVLMRLLVHQAHLPVLGANVVAIGCCSLLNFWLGDTLVFAKFKKVEAKSMAKSLCASCYLPHVFALLLLLGGSSRLHAQAQTVTSNPNPYSHGLGTDSAYENFFVGPAASTQGNSTKATFNGGVTLGEYWARTLGKGFNASPQFELVSSGLCRAAIPSTVWQVSISCSQTSYLVAVFTHSSTVAIHDFLSLAMPSTLGWEWTSVRRKRVGSFVLRFATTTSSRAPDSMSSDCVSGSVGWWPTDRLSLSGSQG